MNDNQITCPTCGGNFNTQEEIEAHAKQMHEKKEEKQEENTLFCSKCGLKAKTVDEMNKHKTNTASDAQHQMA